MIYIWLTFLQVIRRKIVVPADSNFEQPFKVTLTKKSKKDGACDTYYQIDI